jgi:hypothetical protein
MDKNRKNYTKTNEKPVTIVAVGYKLFVLSFLSNVTPRYLLFPSSHLKAAAASETCR